MPAFQKTKPSFLEAGLPCSSLSAECQRDNNARVRPPQNRLHIWWARRPPTICRAAILSALLPHDLDLDEALLPALVGEPDEEDIEKLPRKFRAHQAFFERLLREVGPTPLTARHAALLRALGVRGDPNRAWRRMALREQYLVGGAPILLPMNWTYRHEPAFAVTPSSRLMEALLASARELVGIKSNGPVRVLDSMAGGGAIPFDAVRYGCQVYANDLNPVAALTLKATVEYPTRFGGDLLEHIRRYVLQIDAAVRKRLLHFFYVEPPEVWWEHEKERSATQFRSKSIVRREPAEIESSKNCTLWCRLVDCPTCGLEIPLSTNFFIVKRKGKPADDLAAFPEVPSREQGNRCTFRVVGPAEWKDCRWPRPDFEQWHPTETPTFKDGKATCPRCGHVAEGEEVKAEAKKGPGGLPSQMYAVCSQVPVLLTYRNGEQKVRYLWRFRPPTEEDLAAVRAAEAEVARLRAKWAAEDLVPTEEIPEGEKTREPRNMGMTRWSDLFLPRQLLTAVTVLEEIRAAQARAQAELPAHEAEAISVYLSFMLSKVLNYNSVNTFWHYGRRQVAQSFSRHDFAFRPAFCEFEGARETVKWAASQVLGAYAQLAGLIHGAAVELSGGDDEGEPEDAVGEVESDATDEDAAHAVPAEPMTAGPANFRLRPEVIVPTVTCEDAAALSEPKPGTVHLICVDPPYYSNLQYAELSNFFYVWLKRALRGWPGLAHLFREPLAETNREAVANGARWKRDADEDLAAWRARYDEEFGCLRVKVKAAAAKKLAVAAAGPKPPTAKDRADRFYEDKMAAVFRRARQLLHPAGRMVVMFNHKETEAWQSLGMALIRAGFEIRSSVPIHTEAESSLNIRGLDAVRSTVLLLCLPREEAEQPVGNWTTVQSQVARTARGAAEKFQKDGLSGTDLYLSTLGPVLRVVGQQWPVTDFAGRPIDLEAALNEAYKAVGQWRLEQVFAELTKLASFANVGDGFSAEGADRDSQILWLWLDTFQGPVASSDDVRKMAKALNIDPNEFGRIGLIRTEKDMFILRAPQEVDLGRLSFHLASGELPRGRRTAGGDAWEKRTFPNFVGAAVWNAIALMAGTGVQAEARGPEALRRWLSESGYGLQREFRGAFAITLHLLETAFPPRQGDDDTGDSWREAVRQGKRAWDLVIQSWRT